MNKPDDLEIPLFEFFSALRQYDRESLGRPGLGTDEFVLVLEQLAQGHGQFSETNLYVLCKLLWLKPYHNEKVFRQYFEQYLSDRMARLMQDSKRRLAKDLEAAGEQTSEAKTEEPEQEEAKSAAAATESKEEEKETEIPEQHEQKEEPTSEAEPRPKFNNVFLDLQEGGGLTAAAEDPQEMMNALRKRIYGKKTKKYKLRSTHFSLTSRLMQQSFQLIREVVREGRKNEIDWDKTIDRVARQAHFDQLVMRATPQIRSNLHILIDHEGSMIAFDELTKTMVRALKNYTGKQTQSYYFRNCPEQVLYENEMHTRAIRLEQFCQTKPRSVIIVSDGGAARGHLNQERVRQTKTFLDDMRSHRVVWLNPMPEDRWEDTSADYIYGMVPMYELNERGMITAIKALKLKHRQR